MLSIQTNKLALSLMALAFIGCASQPKATPVDEKVKAERPADNPEQIVSRAAETFASAPGLNLEQKQKLATIYTKVYAESMAIRTEIGQSKSLLFKMLATQNFKSSELNQLKNKITALDQKRLNIMFTALDDVQKVVGYGPEKEEIYRRLRDYDFHNMGSTSQE